MIIDEYICVYRFKKMASKDIQKINLHDINFKFKSKINFIPYVENIDLNVVQDLITSINIYDSILPYTTINKSNITTKRVKYVNLDDYAQDIQDLVDYWDIFKIQCKKKTCDYLMNKLDYNQFIILKKTNSLWELYWDYKTTEIMLGLE